MRLATTVIALSLLSSAVSAHQQAPPSVNDIGSPPPLEVLQGQLTAAKAIAHQSLEREMDATAEVVVRRRQVADLTKEGDALHAELDKLKAAKEKQETDLHGQIDSVSKERDALVATSDEQKSRIAALSKARDALAAENKELKADALAKPGVDGGINSTLGNNATASPPDATPAVPGTNLPTGSDNKN